MAKKDVKTTMIRFLKAERINKFIKEAENLKANFENRVNSIKADEETQKARLDVKYAEMKQDLKDLIELSKQKIDKEKAKIEGLETELDNQLKDLDNELEREIAKLKELYAVKKKRLKKIQL